MEQQQSPETEQQQSQKTGKRSDAQKLEGTRGGNASIPQSNPDAGAFGEHKSDTPTDQDTALGKLRPAQDH
jgi:hypothetical protein